RLCGGSSGGQRCARRERAARRGSAGSLPAGQDDIGERFVYKKRTRAMSRTLLSLACHGDIIAAILYLAYLIRQWRFFALGGRVLVGGGLLLHAVTLGGELAGQGGMPVGLAQGLSAVAFLLLAIFFVLDLRFRIPVMGAFITPAAVAVLLPALLISGREPIPSTFRRPLLPVHITIALAGLAPFPLAPAPPV